VSIPSAPLISDGTIGSKTLAAPQFRTLLIGLAVPWIVTPNVHIRLRRPKMELAGMRTRVSEIFSAILVFCPDFPPAAETSMAIKFRQLTEFIDAILERTRGEDAKQLLRICLDEIRQSLRYYEQGDQEMGRELIQRAEAHFNNMFSKKTIGHRFIVGESGPARDTDAGFPQ
jgi:hypothetical protein